MLNSEVVPELLEIVDVDNIHVYNPVEFLFICGGKTDVESIPPVSLRDLFLKQHHAKNFVDASTILAEEINGAFPLGNYDNILELETDIAQISQLVIIFTESYGSIAELGSFCVIEAISDRLLVFIDDKNYNDLSFIKLGPLRLLERTYGANRVAVLPLKKLNIKTIENIDGIDISYFSHVAQHSLDAIWKSLPRESKFDRISHGHISRLMVGLIQNYGALDQIEIEIFLFHLGIQINSTTVENLLLCTKFLEWIGESKIGARKFYFPKTAKKATNFKFKLESGYNISKYRTAVLDHWKRFDRIRFDLISETAGSLK